MRWEDREPCGRAGDEKGGEKGGGDGVRRFDELHRTRPAEDYERGEREQESIPWNRNLSCLKVTRAATCRICNLFTLHVNK